MFGVFGGKRCCIHILWNLFHYTFLANIPDQEASIFYANVLDLDTHKSIAKRADPLSALLGQPIK